MDETQMMEFVGQAVADVGALLGGALVVLGDKLGLYRAMAGTGSVTPGDLAARTGTAERYVREWLSAQAARGYLSYDGGGRFSLPDEHAVPLTDETSAACVIGAFEIALGSVYATDEIAERFRSGDGLAWGAHDEHVLRGCERFFRPGYLNNLASAWIPGLDGVEAKLAAGARVADVGCGHGASTLLLADAYPASTIVGFDAHDGSIEAARKRAADAGLAERVRFEVASATTFSGTYDLVCFFDCLHDMGDPAGACAHARDQLTPGGTLMLIEPFADDDITGNLNPVGALIMAFRPCCARRVLCRRTSAPPWAHRPVRPGCARSSPAQALRHCGGWRRPRSTSCSRHGPDPAILRYPEVWIMKFAQIIEFTTGCIDEFNVGLDEWMARSEGHRIPHRAVLRRDRDAQDRYLLMVEFASHEQGMENSGRPETGEFATFLAGISDGTPTFRNLDVLREEDL